MLDSPSVRDLFDFHGRVALITGSGRGIGRGIAARFAAAGAAVAVHYKTSRTGADELVSQIRAQGGQAQAFCADLNQPEQAASLCSAAAGAFGRLDFLINNAGSFFTRSIFEMQPQEWDSVLGDNLRSLFLCTQAAGKIMAAQGGGAMVNIASIEGLTPAPGHSHYDAAKAGVIMLTRSAAQEFGPLGIRVNAVSPGLIWREGIETQWPEGVQAWRAAAPLGRLGTPDDVADACLFLCSPGARWITGINLVLDGGASTRPPF